MGWAAFPLREYLKVLFVHSVICNLIFFLSWNSVFLICKLTHTVFVRCEPEIEKNVQFSMSVS